MGCHFLLQGIFPTPGIELGSPAVQTDSLLSEPLGSPSLEPLREPYLRPSPLNLVFMGELLEGVEGSHFNAQRVQQTRALASCPLLGHEDAAHSAGSPLACDLQV